MRVAIVGAGAVGSLVAARLAHAGCEVTLVGRPRQIQALHSHPLYLEEGGQRRAVRGVRAVRGLAAVAREDPVDLLVVTVKAYDTETVAGEIARVWSSPPRVLTLQNGVGNEEVLAEFVGAGRVLAGAITTPVEVVAPGHVRVSRPSYRIGLAPVKAGAENEALLRHLGMVLAREGFRVQYTDDYRALKWTKLLFNITANAQCAILAWTPAQVFAHPVAGALEVRGWREALAVMRALEVRPLAFGGYPLPLLVPLIRRGPLGVVRRFMGWFAAGGRGEKMPSVYLDLERGQDRTEVPWLNGAVARYGRGAGLSTPVNITFDALVAATAHGRLSLERTRGRPELLRRAVTLAEVGHNPLDAYQEPCASHTHCSAMGW